VVPAVLVGGGSGWHSVDCETALACAIDYAIVGPDNYISCVHCHGHDGAGGGVSW
jgi:hypothetical protein